MTNSEAAEGWGHTDKRSEPHPRRFVCTNANLQVPHIFSILPGDPGFVKVIGKKRPRLVYLCPEDDSRMFSRRTVTMDLHYPEPKELLTTMDGARYQDFRGELDELEATKTRDRAFISLLYVPMLRVLEASRLRREQFTIEESRVKIENIRLAKRRFVDYRKEAFLPLHGERAPFTESVIAHLSSSSESLLFPGRRKDNGATLPLTTRQGWNIVNRLTGQFNHFFRALGEDYMVHHGTDVNDLGGYIKVNPAIISRYVHNKSKVPVI